MSRGYIVITPARDEEKTVEKTIASMLAQTLRPLRWVIVNDGSTDATRALVEKHLAANPWIELVDRQNRGFRALGGGVVDAFNEGFERAAHLPWDFVVKLAYQFIWGNHFAHPSNIGDSFDGATLSFDLAEHTHYLPRLRSHPDQGVQHHDAL